MNGHRIAAIDHSFHKKTHSTEFIFDILAECGAVERFYCDRWQGGHGVDIEAIRRGRYDAIVFIQQMYRRRELRRLGNPRKLVLVPMYDGLADWTQKHWRRYRPFQLISFSSTLHHIATAAGCRSVYVRYFPEVQAPVQQTAVRSRPGWTVFFWERQPAITWATVKKVLGDLPVARVWYKPCLDPGARASEITDEDRRRFNIEEVGWLPSREEYLRFVAQSDIYVAPRRYEGIGMSFLEAMALGKVVVAPNHATMNEYVTHVRNGVLYDLDRPVARFAGCDVRAMMAHVDRDRRTFAEEWKVGRTTFKTLIAAACAERQSLGGTVASWFRNFIDADPRL